MENASKALIIAGAILLSILIISLGIMIFQQAAGVVNNNAMDELEVTQFNQKFSQYFGNNVRGSNVNALLNAVANNNRSQDDESKKVGIIDADASLKIGANSSKAETEADQIIIMKAKTGNTYNVTATKFTKGGLISEITIKDNSKSTSTDKN